jgi:hypothetical protein
MNNQAVMKTSWKLLMGLAVCFFFLEYINFSGMLNGDDSLRCDVEVLFPSDEQIIFIYLRMCVCFLRSTVNTSLCPHVAIDYCESILFATRIQSTRKDPARLSPLQQITISCINSFIRLQLTI